MKLKLVVLMVSFLVLLVLPILGQQTDSLLVEFCKLKRYDTLIQKLNELTRVDLDAPEKTPKIEKTYGMRLGRELVDGYFEEILELEIVTWGEKNPAIGEVEFYRIYLLHKNEYLLYIKIVNATSGTSPENDDRIESLISEYTNKEEMVQLNSAFNKSYGCDINFARLFTTTVVYGTRCGIGGTEPEYRTLLNALVRENDQSSLKTWLCSTITELQIYALDGFLQLYQKGKKIDPDVLNPIKKISEKKGTAFTCSGCIHWHTPIIEVVSELYTKYKYQ